MEKGSKIVKNAFDNIDKDSYDRVGVKMALYNTNYAIMTLEKERDIYIKLLEDWDINKDKESRKVRDNRLKQLNKAINILNE